MNKFIFLLLLALAKPAYCDPAATHGMAVIGQSAVYLSHLPMFHSPHDYQAIFSSEFDQPRLSAYLNPAANPSETFYTLAPVPFVLPTLAATLSSKPVALSGQLFTGVFDEGGSPITSTFRFVFSHVLYFRKFVPGEAHPSHPLYILFGNTQTGVYAAHVIHSAPDFDQILQVNGLGSTLLAALKAGPIEVMLPELADRPLEPPDAAKSHH